MKKNKKESFFWTSYSDLMTSLFFIMLVLFVLVIVLLHNEIATTKTDNDATKEQLNKIKELNESIEKIDENYFIYDSVFKRHTLKNVSVKFKTGSDNIDDIDSTNRNRLIEAGRAIQEFMGNTKNGAEYLLIIEGQSSKDTYQFNDELSYKRALSLVGFWRDNNIKFDSLPCEVIISGSGISSKFRLPEKDEHGKINQANQRFVIHVIPKPGIIE